MTCGIDDNRNRSAMPLETETQTYEKRLLELLAHEGKFVLLHETDVSGFFDTYADALQAGYERFALEPFMIKQVAATEQTQFITIGAPCPI
jgi:hypothetical protein